MLKHQVNLCEKQDGTFEPRYVNLTKNEIKWYKTHVLKILSSEDYEELVEAPCKERSALVEKHLKEHFKGRVDHILWLA